MHYEDRYDFSELSREELEEAIETVQGRIDSIYRGDPNDENEDELNDELFDLNEALEELDEH